MKSTTVNILEKVAHGAGSNLYEILFINRNDPYDSMTAHYFANDEDDLFEKVEDNENYSTDELAEMWGLEIQFKLIGKKA